MPELPEVETTRRTLQPLITGAVINRAALGKPLRWPLGIAPEALVGLRFGVPHRRGKYLWLPLLPGPAAPTACSGGLLIHLGMSGALTMDDSAATGDHLGDCAVLEPHVHFRAQTDRGCLQLKDPRRFGAVIWAHSLVDAPVAKLLSRLGREPDDAELTPAWFHAQLQQRRAPIKQVLLGGDVMVGAGNIYACEALFAAGISPVRPAQRISRQRAERLLECLRSTLSRALAAGGTTLRDFRDAHGMGGAFQHEAQVYGREGAACVRCTTPIRRVVQAQRSTYYCPKCQR